MSTVSETATAPSNRPDQRDPNETLHTLIDEHDLTVEEWDTSTLGETLRNKFGAFYVETAGRKVIVVPAGQDPAHRLAAVRALIAHPGVSAR